MANIEIITKEGKMGILMDGKEVVPCVHDNSVDAISEWEYFERMNTESSPNKRFLDRVTPVEEIELIVSKLTK